MMTIEEKKARAEKQILAVIAKNKKIRRNEHIFKYYRGISAATFYSWGLGNLESIKKALEHNRELLCSDLQERWEISDNPTLQLALYRLNCNDEERDRLSTSVKADVKSSGKQEVVLSFEEKNADNES